MSKKISGLKTEPMSSVFGSDSGSVLFTITIPDVPPSLNVTTRMKGFANWRLKNKWVLLVRSQIVPLKQVAVGRVHCLVTLHHSRMYDKDNAYGACKPLVDALRHWKLIFNDTTEWLELEVEQAKCPHKTRHTVVEIKPTERLEERALAGLARARQEKNLGV